MSNDALIFLMISHFMSHSAFTFNLSFLCVCVWFCVCFPVLGPCPGAEARRCNSIYKGFAQCLMALGDSLTDSARKDEDTHEIHSICRSVSMNTYGSTQTHSNLKALSLFNRKSAKFQY